MNGKKWENSIYTKIVRISKEDLEFLKDNKEKLSIAGFLHFLIQFYKAKQ